jgi:hypothetical protein
METFIEMITRKLQLHIGKACEAKEQLIMGDAQFHMKIS